MTHHSANRHNEELSRAREVWEAKPLLRRAYADLRERFRPHLSRGIPGKLLEIGSGLGAMKETFPDVLTTDLFPNPNIDAVASAYALPVEDQSLSNILLVDVWHHLERPLAFLKDARRALSPGGRVLMIEPDLSLAARLVYGPLHPEPIGKPEQVDLQESPPERPGYVAYQGLAHWCFVQKRLNFWANDWSLVHLQRFACGAYWATGGFSRPSLVTPSGYRAMSKIDHWLSRFPALFSGRVLIVLERG